MPFSIKDLNIPEFWNPHSPRTNPLWTPRIDCPLGCRERGLIGRKIPKDLPKKVTAEQRSEEPGTLCLSVCSAVSNSL